MIKNLALLAVGLLPCTAFGAAELSLLDYLAQVRGRNQAVTASEKTSSGAKERSVEASLLFSPTLFGNATMSSDASTSVGIQRSKLIFDNYTLGVAKQFNFGLNAKLYYALNFTSFYGLNPISAAAMGLTNPNYYDAKPAIELTQSLWRNFGGTETRATEELAQAAALATHFGESYKIKALLAQAEAAYWQLALARDTVTLTRENLDRSIKLRDWSQRRVNLQLADRSDLLQAEAALKLRELDLQQAIDAENAATRAFNSARGMDSETVEEKLPTLTQTVLSEIQTPSRAPYREDVLAAREQERITRANASIGSEKNVPTLEAFAQLALNGHDTDLGTSMSNSFSTNNPTTAIGVRFTAPLDFGTLRADRAGYAKERQGAEDALNRKLFEQEREWKDLSAKLQETRVRLDYAQKLEAAQKEKLTVEKDRLSRGRTTTYQVLLFEQDYTLAQLLRITTEAALLGIIAQMRTFSAGGTT